MIDALKNPNPNLLFSFFLFRRYENALQALNSKLKAIDTRKMWMELVNSNSSENQYSLKWMLNNIDSRVGPRRVARFTEKFGFLDLVQMAQKNLSEGIKQQEVIVNYFRFLLFPFLIPMSPLIILLRKMTSPEIPEHAELWVKVLQHILIELKKVTAFLKQAQEKKTNTEALLSSFKIVSFFRGHFLPSLPPPFLLKQY